jgi:EmrB/QacA subfamily drug resistance transporter
MVNVTLPTLVVDLGAGTKDLQWIIDAYTLTFAALVLAAGSLGDRFGRRGTLVVGLVIYGVGNAAAAFASSTEALVATRAIMGVGAAVIFPTTLSIITNVFTERGERARAIGLWGAATGIAIAMGPIAGGALLEAFSWPATFVAKVPVAIGAIALVAWVVPDSRDPEAPRIDFPGLLLSTAAVGLLVFGLIEAPKAGWLSGQTLALIGSSAVAIAAFIAWERRTDSPMLDVRIFRNLRFSAASIAVAVGFFALAGFIFLVTQYFQFLKEYSAFETGLRMLPVATAVAVSSIVGTRLAVRFGTKFVVGGGMLLLATAYAWISTASTGTAYLEIALQMVVLGTGMGLTSAPATESIMGAVSDAKAGIGSAVNDTTRELGATLGVAVIGSVFASLYDDAVSGAATRGLPDAALGPAQDSIGAALIAAGRLADAGATEAAATLAGVASAGFFDGMQAGCLVAAAVCLAGALVCFAILPAHPVEASSAMADPPPSDPGPAEPETVRAPAGSGAA